MIKTQSGFLRFWVLLARPMSFFKKTSFFKKKTCFFEKTSFFEKTELVAPTMEKNGDPATRFAINVVNGK